MGNLTMGLISLMALAILTTSAVQAASCLAPPRPFVPSNREDAREYADLIRADFETYLAEIEDYFRCLDGERARAFAEAAEVAQEYGRFIEAVRD